MTETGQSYLRNEIGPPHMAPEETAVLERWMNSGISRYLEFGLGGSTLLAVRSNIAEIIAVESDPAWADAVKLHHEIAPRTREGSVSILHADIGPTAMFGSPATTAFIQRWPRYIQLPWSEWQSRNRLPQLVLVDGRFRVACCLSIIMVGYLESITKQPTVILHDVVPERASYDTIFEFFDVIEAVKTLRVLKVKQSISSSKVLVRFLESQFDGY